MPQMAPLNWLTLFMFFLLTFLFILNMIYFMFIKNNKKILTKNNKIKNYNKFI